MCIVWKNPGYFDPDCFDHLTWSIKYFWIKDLSRPTSCRLPWQHWLIGRGRGDDTSSWLCVFSLWERPTELASLTTPLLPVCQKPSRINAATYHSMSTPQPITAQGGGAWERINEEETRGRNEDGQGHNVKDTQRGTQYRVHTIHIVYTQYTHTHTHLTVMDRFHHRVMTSH